MTARRAAMPEAGAIMSMSGPCRVAVAYSGGRDSTALLHATARAARAHGQIEVVALHVHHGLSVHADTWLAHAEGVCQAWADEGLPLHLVSRRVTVGVGAGVSVEAEARRARYAALTDMALQAGADVILLAHHRRDQAETVLLQALRGAGVRGLAAMPLEAERDGLRWVRPWLRHTREAIEAYVLQHGLPYIEDDSNAHGRFARNRLRLRVWPTLLASFPDAEAALSASARRVSDALPAVTAWRHELVESLRCSAGTTTSAGATGRPDGLDAARWSELSGAQRRESLAHWYGLVTGRSLGASWLERLAHEVPGLVHHQKTTLWAPIGLGLYRGVLEILQDQPVHGADARVPDGAGAAPVPVDVGIAEPGDHLIAGWAGVLRVAPVDKGGVLPATLANLRATARLGGEQFQAGAGRPARSLKKQYQAAGVPPWARQGPILWSCDQLVFVPGLGVDARAAAAAGQVQWSLSWIPLAG